MYPAAGEFVNNLNRILKYDIKNPFEKCVKKVSK